MIVRFLKDEERGELIEIVADVFTHVIRPVQEGDAEAYPTEWAEYQAGDDRPHEGRLKAAHAKARKFSI